MSQRDMFDRERAGGDFETRKTVGGRQGWSWKRKPLTHLRQPKPIREGVDDTCQLMPVRGKIFNFTYK